MTASLASSEVEELLVRLGAQLYRSPMYAATYVLPVSGEKVCVKRSRSGQPVMKQPLVINPRHAKADNWTAICGLLGAPNLHYRNADLHGFPLSPTGQSKTGIAFDVPGFDSLRAIVGLLAGISGDVGHGWQAAKLELDADPAVAHASPTERNRLIAARLGQGRFREDLLKY